MIHLFDQFYLDADNQQYILYEWDGTMNKASANKAETKRFKNICYFSSFKSLLDRATTFLVRRAVASSTDLTELGNKLDAIKETIEELTRRMWPTIEDAREGACEPVGDVPA